ncbi:Uncharacterised protein [Mycobacterium tuberculosis]|nr:Uncharacterised protein [Mycobacterium tuberculosis]
MRNLARRALTAIAAAATTIALTAVPAFAGPFTAVNTGNVVLYRTNGVPVAVCSSSTVAGTSSSGAPPLVMASVAFSVPGNPNNWCTSSGGTVIDVVAENLPWTFVPGVGTAGELTGVELMLTNSRGCNVTITGPGGAPGEIPGTHTGSPAILDLEGTLVVASASASCDPSWIDVGDIVVFRAQYEIL